jgi:hypothetical protein
VTVPAILDPPGSIFYHYTTLAKALELIVPAQRLRLSPFSSMRDPRESSDWSITGGGYGEHDRDDLRNWGEFTRAVNELKGFVKVLSLTRDDPAASAADFGRGYAHPRLWEQYADKHRGVCLCFNAETLTDRLTTRLAEYGEPHHREVSYVDGPIASEALFVIVKELRDRGVTDAALNHLRKNIDELFFTKLTDWATEVEYRFVVVAQSDRLDPILVRVKPALCAVILGADDGSRFYEPAFAKICDPVGVEIFYMQWIHGSPHLAPRYEPSATRPASD